MEIAESPHCGKHGPVEAVLILGMVNPEIHPDPLQEITGHIDMGEGGNHKQAGCKVGDPPFPSKDPVALQLKKQSAQNQGHH